jgi:hypothetical protein
VSANAEQLRDKRVLMYCTGGVRCEKASSWLRASGLASEVCHLQGGIHRYVEAFGEEEGLWHGRNVVFDRRGALGGDGAPATAPSRFVVGRCVGCGGPWEELDGLAVCTACNEPLLACDACRAARREHHCEEHAHLRRCFFRQLARFSADELWEQLDELSAMHAGLEAEGRRSAGRRRTLAAQATRVRARLDALQRGDACGDADDDGAAVTAADGDAPAGEDEAAAPQAPPQLLWVRGRFPTDAAAARVAWPSRIWPLSARPWAFIREARADDGASSLCVEVDCKIADDPYDAELGARLAPQGRPARTRVWAVAWDDARNASQLAVAVQPPAGAEQRTQTLLHLRWLGFEPIRDAA